MRFVNALLNDSTFLLTESLVKLANIKQLEIDTKNKELMDSLSEEDREVGERERER